MAAIAYFVVAIAALHVLRPDLDLVRRPTSEYAVGPHGWVMASAFFSMSIATWALVVGLSRAVSRSTPFRIGLALLGVWGVGVLIAMLFPIDVEGAPPTLAGTIHRINGPLGFLSATMGVLLVSAGLHRGAAWRSVARVARILAFIMVALFVATIVSRAMGISIAGLLQRLSLVALIGWIVVVAKHLQARNESDRARG